MKTLKWLLLALVFIVISCEKDAINSGENTPTNTNNEETSFTTTSKDDFTIEVLKLDGPLVMLRSGGRRPILYRNSFTTRNYLLAGSSDYVPTENTFNKDSVDNIIFKRNGVSVNVEGSLHGAYAVVVTFKDNTIHEDNYFVKNGPDYYVLYPGGVNTYTQTKNFNTIARPINATQPYYDYRFGKIKNRHLFSVIDKDTTIQTYIQSNTMNGNIFGLTHIQ